MTENKDSIAIFKGEIPGYELIDSGNKRRLERFAHLKVIRHEPKAWWSPASPSDWKGADAEYGADGVWRFKNGSPPAPFAMRTDSFRFELKFSDTSRHLGVFPEQSPHWDYIMKFQGLRRKNVRPSLLNLFGYTGVASLAAVSAGFDLLHLDASKPAVEWAKKNFQLSGFSDKPARFILDDASKFVKRELRRGRRYDAIILDPPSFGRGPSKELWKAEDALPELLSDCGKLLSDNPLFVILTMYSIDASSLMLGNMLARLPGASSGKIVCGELGLGQKNSSTILPLSIFSRLEFGEKI